MRIPFSAKLTLWANRCIAVILLALIFLMPGMLRWYMDVRPMRPSAALAVAVAFYCCCVPIGAALWDLDRILRNILRQEVFSRCNVRCIRRLRWYCLAVSIFCLPAAWFYPPLVFMTVVMAFLTLVVSVVAAVMRAAVEIREENDLTI